MNEATPLSGESVKFTSRRKFIKNVLFAGGGALAVASFAGMAYGMDRIQNEAEHDADIMFPKPDSGSLTKAEDVIESVAAGKYEDLQTLEQAELTVGKLQANSIAEDKLEVEKGRHKIVATGLIGVGTGLTTMAASEIFIKDEKEQS